MIRAPLPVLVLGVLVAGCAVPESEDGSDSPGLTLAQTHVHGVDRPEPDGPILLATHDGLWKQEDGELSRAGPVMDLMGFSVVDGSTLRASGHPPVGSGLPDPLGLIESTDGGQTWTPLSRVGLSDFHVLESNARLTVGFDGLLRWTTNGVQWHDTPAPQGLVDLAMNPISEVVIATTTAGTLASDDRGQSWTRMPEAPDLIWVDWADEDRLVGLDGRGGLHISQDGGQTWAQGPQIGDAPVHAMSAGTTAEGKVEVLLVGDAEVVAHQW